MLRYVVPHLFVLIQQSEKKEFVGVVLPWPIIGGGIVWDVSGGPDSWFTLEETSPLVEFKGKKVKVTIEVVDEMS